MGTESIVTTPKLDRYSSQKTCVAVGCGTQGGDGVRVGTWINSAGFVHIKQV